MEPKIVNLNNLEYLNGGIEAAVYVDPKTGRLFKAFFCYSHDAVQQIVEGAKIADVNDIGPEVYSSVIEYIGIPVAPSYLKKHEGKGYGYWTERVELKEVPIEDERCLRDRIRDVFGTIYTEAMRSQLDISSYNIGYKNDIPVLIDFGACSW